MTFIQLISSNLVGCPMSKQSTTKARPAMQGTLEDKIRTAQLAANPGHPWEYGRPATMQRLIDSGEVWGLEGAAGRAAARALKSGECFLPPFRRMDYWGNVIPSRDELEPGSKGTLANSARFWEVEA